MSLEGCGLGQISSKFVPMIFGMGWAKGIPRTAWSRAVAVSAFFFVLLLAAGAEGPAETQAACLLRASTRHGLSEECLLLRAQAAFAPRTLPRSERAPIAFYLESKLTGYEEPPPVLREGVLDLDKHVAVHVPEVPPCAVKLATQGEISRLRRMCPESVVGAGRAGVEVEDPETGALTVTSLQLLIFAGGPSGRPALLFWFEPLAPSRTPTFAVARSQPLDRGRLGTRMTIAFPRFAEGTGSIVSMRFNLRRRAPGRSAGVMSASCPDEHLVFRFSGVSTDGTVLRSTSVRSCSAAL